MKIAILQSYVPHYRCEFFERLSLKFDTDLYIYQKNKKTIELGLSLGNVKTTHISGFEWHKFVFYNPWHFYFKRKYDYIILPLNIGYVTTWIILLLNIIIQRKIILWGHGISVKRYLVEENHPDWKIKLMISLSNGLWTYMEKEANQWQRIFPQKTIVALNNTVSNVEEMIKFSEEHKVKDGNRFKKKYNIEQNTILLFCARFEENNRRTDLLLDAINKLDKNKYGFIIIGAGKNKPDFSSFDNVYDMGAIYDTKIKRELFCLADVYFQPGWVGLSIVEAMAYGLPVFTFKRSINVKQCVEYSYIKHGINGWIVNSVNELVSNLDNFSKPQLTSMGINARNYIKNNATVNNMVRNACSILK